MRMELLGPAEATSPALTVGATAFDDLGLAAVADAMGEGDPFVREVAATLLPAGPTAPNLIRYRQAVFADCLAEPDLLRALYRIGTAAGEIRWWTVGRQREPRGKLRLALGPLGELIDRLRELRLALDRAAPRLRSAGFARLIATVREILTDEWAARAAGELAALEFADGIRFSAALGPGDTSTGHVLHPPPARRSRFGRRGPGLAVHVSDSVADGRALERLGDPALAATAELVSGAADVLTDVFARLRAAAAFYLGGVLLHRRVRAAGLPTCVPDPCPPGRAVLRCTGLRDAGLAVRASGPVAGNDLAGDDRLLFVVTGANNGGKSTFLRSLGAAQILLQAGLFVIAESFAADVRDGVYTRFGTEEDASSGHGRLVAELVRLRELTDAVGPGALVLCNEPLTSTDERAAARIGVPVVAALHDCGVKTVVVTHQHELARGLCDRVSAALPLRATVTATGARTFRIEPGEPEPAGHGIDLFERVFESDVRGERPTDRRD